MTALIPNLRDDELRIETGVRFDPYFPTPLTEAWDRLRPGGSLPASWIEPEDIGWELLNQTARHHGERTAAACIRAANLIPILPRGCR